MEQPINDLSIFTDYRNRQVILNYYQEEDGMLYNRDGFHFISIQVDGASLVFTKKDENKAIISVQDYPIQFKNTDFPNYYIFQNSHNRLEIYFP